MSTPSRALVFVKDGFPDKGGAILLSTGAFEVEVADGGPDITDHNLPMPPHKHVGLLIFEGWVEYGPADDDDPQWLGEWRRLTHWEMSRTRFGMVPWDG